MKDPHAEEIEQLTTENRVRSAIYDHGLSENDQRKISAAMDIPDLPPEPDPDPRHWPGGAIILTRKQFNAVVREAEDEGFRQKMNPVGVIILITIPFVIGLLIGLWF